MLGFFTGLPYYFVFRFFINHVSFNMSSYLNVNIYKPTHLVFFCRHSQMTRYSLCFPWPSNTRLQLFKIDASHSLQVNWNRPKGIKWILTSNDIPSVLSYAECAERYDLPSILQLAVDLLARYDVNLLKQEGVKDHVTGEVWTDILEKRNSLLTTCLANVAGNGKYFLNNIWYFLKNCELKWAYQIISVCLLIRNCTKNTVYT